MLPKISSAATGDVLASCSFDEAGTTATQVLTSCGWYKDPTIDISASIVADGHDGGKAISYYYPNTFDRNNPTDSEIVKVFAAPNFTQKSELTIEYWEKFDVPISVSGIWNVKSIRVYNGGSGYYMGGMMSRWTDGQWQQGNFATGTLTTESGVSFVNTDAGYCTLINGNSYNCPNGRASIKWTNETGTNWYKVRVYLKAPSSAAAADGVTKVWINDNLIYTVNYISGTSSWSPYITGINFHPSDDFFQGTSLAWQSQRVTFHHLYDDIKIYDGYVPPTSSDVVSPSQPSELNVQ